MSDNTFSEQSMLHTLRSYITGFSLSLALTLAAYLIVVQSRYSKWAAVGITGVMALLQFVVQLVLFLHLGSEHKPRWKLLAFSFMITVVLILVIGSLWIMYSLNYRMNHEQTNTYMQNQDGGI